jgi:hypothetical protein
MPIFEENDPYENVPHNGKRFTENGKTFYWNFSNVKPGTRHKGKNKAWVTLGPVQRIDEAEPRVHPMFPGSLPVTMFQINVPGFYYEIDYDAVAVENKRIQEGTITKWRDDAPISGAQQTTLAWNSRSVEEYEAMKQALLTNV